MSRSLKKGPFVDTPLLEKIEAMNQGKEKKVVKTWSRRSTVVPDHLGDDRRTARPGLDDLLLAPAVHRLDLLEQRRVDKRTFLQ